MKKRIKARGKDIQEVRKIYKDVIDMQSPNWAIAAIARQGEMTEEFSNAIYGYPAPPRYTEDQKEERSRRSGRPGREVSATCHPIVYDLSQARADIGVV